MEVNNLSVGLFKFDGNLYDFKSKVVLSKNIASEQKYYKYLDKAIKELNIKYFKDGSEIRKKDMAIVMQELDMIIGWVQNNVNGYDLLYLMERLKNMKEIIPQELNNEEDVLYIF